MKELKTDIYNSLGKNTSTTRLAIITSGIVSIVALVLVFVMHLYHDRLVYGLAKDKSLLPLELLDKEEVKEIYKKGAVEYFLFSFYTINQYNYKEQVEKALWLIDTESGNRLYEGYRQQGYYNTMIQSSSNQYVKDVEVVFDSNDNFKAGCTIVISKPNQKDPRNYRLIVEGTLDKVTPNYPKNPYGYIIYNFREVNKTEIEDE